MIDDIMAVGVPSVVLIISKNFLSGFLCNMVRITKVPMKSKISAIKDQVKANEIALDGVQKEEALGNRTILDVLDAYQELLNSNVNEVTARRDYYVSAMQLLLSMGKLTAKDLKLGVDLYDAKKFYKETKDKWLALE